MSNANEFNNKYMGVLQKPSGIPFTQYLLPNGRKVQQWIDRPHDVEQKAFDLIKRGVSFDMELLSDYCTVSFTSQISGQEDTLVHELCLNGPDVLETVDKLVNSTFEKMKGHQ